MVSPPFRCQNFLKMCCHQRAFFPSPLASSLLFYPQVRIGCVRQEHTLYVVSGLLIRYIFNKLVKGSIVSFLYPLLHLIMTCVIGGKGSRQRPEFLQQEVKIVSANGYICSYIV